MGDNDNVVAGFDCRLTVGQNHPAFADDDADDRAALQLFGYSFDFPAGDLAGVVDNEPHRLDIDIGELHYRAKMDHGR